MSDFYDMLDEGFVEFEEQITDAAGDPIEVEYNGLSRPCVPASSAQQKELRDSGLFEQGMVLVEMRRVNVTALGLKFGTNDRAVVQYSDPPNAKRSMKVFVFDNDPADPCQRLTLKPLRA